MSEDTREKDVSALRTAIVCVGLSGVCLGAFAVAASPGEPPWAMAIAAAATGLIVAALGVLRRPAVSLSRSGRIAAFWLLAALLVLELMVPLNYAGAHRRAKWDWTEGGLRTLTVRTRSILDRVDQPVRVTTFVQGDPVQTPIYHVVKDLLDEYQQYNRNITVEHVDPSRDPERMATLAKELQFDPRRQPTFIAFRCGQMRRDVPVMELMSMLPETDLEHPRADQIGFLGEQEFTSAILEVTEKKRKELWFVTGRGEIGPDAPGFARAAAQLRLDNYSLRKLDRLADGVPDNCTVLVLLSPRPKSLYDDREGEAIARFVLRGGALFIGVSGGGPCGIEPLLSDFGIEMGRNIVIDYSTSRAVRTLPVVVTGWHETVRDLRDFKMSFDSARTVEPAQRPPGMSGPGRPEAFPLLGAGRSCWAENNLELLDDKGQAVFDPLTDKRGPLNVAVVYERPDVMADGQPLPPDAPRGRIIAVGSGDFMNDEQYRQSPPANVQFFLNAVNWLARKEALISIPPKRFDYRPLDRLDPSGANLIFWLTAVAMPAVVLALGGVIWLARRRS